MKVKNLMRIRAKGVAETGNNDLDKIVDIAGYDDDVSKSGYPNDVSSTQLWPLHQFPAPAFSNNAFVPNTVHQRNRVKTTDGRNGVGAEGNNNSKTAFGDVGFTGVGYKRLAKQTEANGGTPGYPNDALKGTGSDITSSVYISEIMYANPQDKLSQWIELRNTSKTFGVDLHNWRLTVSNHDDTKVHGDAVWNGKSEASVLLNGLKISPNSTVLITTRRQAQSGVFLPTDAIFILYPKHKTAFGMETSVAPILNTYGFKITLESKAGNNWDLVDEVSNLAGRRRADRGQRVETEFYDKPRWAWPNAVDRNGKRISVARKNSLFTNGVMTKVSNGAEAGSWILTSEDSRTDATTATYYGHRTDISTPGQTMMMPLPVELSSFQPVLEAGKVVIRWTTESELDNAGFNVYRSETRHGEFTQVNAQLIQGAGTTGERTSYEWVDTTAKPDVVYYYQIEDVSYAGERQKLATKRLQGLISAENKLTTRWGKLKSRE